LFVKRELFRVVFPISSTTSTVALSRRKCRRQAKRTHFQKSGGGDVDIYVYYYHNTPMHNAVFRFTVHPSSGLPIYRQVMDQVCALIAGGRLTPGDLLPSVRQLAAELQVNMMTISKAYARLEADGVIERVRGTGMRVKPTSVQGSAAERQEEVRPLVEQAVIRARQLQLTNEQFNHIVQSVLKEHKP
jgi:GntR family transcriptional regulator